LYIWKQVTDPVIPERESPLIGQQPSYVDNQRVLL